MDGKRAGRRKADGGKVDEMCDKHNLMEMKRKGGRRGRGFKLVWDSEYSHTYERVKAAQEFCCRELIPGLGVTYRGRNKRF